MTLIKIQENLWVDPSQVSSLEGVPANSAGQVRTLIYTNRGEIEVADELVDDVAKLINAGLQVSPFPPVFEFTPSPRRKMSAIKRPNEYPLDKTRSARQATFDQLTDQLGHELGVTTEGWPVCNACGAGFKLMLADPCTYTSAPEEVKS